jgi:hypothetical protein
VYTSRVAIQIARPPDEAFAYVSDARNRPEWDESVDSEELTSPEPIGVVSTIRTRMRSMGREYQYTWEITEHEPPNRMKVESTSGPFPTRCTSSSNPRMAEPVSRRRSRADRAA